MNNKRIDRVDWLHLEKKALSFQDRIIHTCQSGSPAWNEYSLRFSTVPDLEHVMRNLLGLRSIKLITPENRNQYLFNEEILCKFQHSSHFQVGHIADSRSLSNIRMVVENNEVAPKAFFKKQVNACREYSDLRNLLSRTHIYVYTEDRKHCSSATFTLLLFYFAANLKLISNTGVDFNFLLGDAATLARTTILGRPEVFVKRFAKFDYCIGELSERGILKSSLYRHYVKGTELHSDGRTSSGYIDSQKNLIALGKVLQLPNDGTVSIEELNSSSTKVVSSASTILVVRKIFQKTEHSARFQYFKFPVTQDSRKLSFHSSLQIA